MKQRLYRLLAGRVPGIRERFETRRAGGMGRLACLICLLWLNVQYYLLGRRSLAQSERYPFYEKRRLYARGSESSLSRRESPEAFAARLAAYDVISFDVFDTLLLRLTDSPAGVFDFVGMELSCPHFRQARLDAEKRAREEAFRKTGSREITLEDIWSVLERETGIPRQAGMEAEWRWERRCCYANPYMLRVVRELRRLGRSWVVTSDMYLGEKRIRALLEENGLGGFAGCLVSCDAGVSKSSGGLYGLLLEQRGGGRAVHTGDHPFSDLRQARRNGLAAFLCPNVQQTGSRFRPQDMSAITGGLYRGLVNARLHAGLTVYSREYEFGYVYGGLFVAGYCRFIHETARAQGADKLLFLARDGAVLREAYRLLYPGEADRTAYVCWSRLAALKLTARYYKRDYLQRFLNHKADQGYSLRRILEAMELSDLLAPLCRAAGLAPDAHLTYKNKDAVRHYLMDNWELVLDHYREQTQAGRLYYGRILEGCRRAAAVDIGWTGSGPVMLDCAVNRLWGLGCRITGILAGTASLHAADPDGMEPFFLDGRLVSYLYSQRDNRDLWKFHDPGAGHNLYWELLLGAPEGSFTGFYPDGNGGAVCRFKPPPPGAGRIRDIHRGILDFVEDYRQAEERLGLPIPISGRDAYAPMLLACGRENRPFLAGLEALLDEKNIG